MPTPYVSFRLAEEIRKRVDLVAVEIYGTNRSQFLRDMTSAVVSMDNPAGQAFFARLVSGMARANERCMQMQLDLVGKPQAGRSRAKARPT